MDCYVHVCIVIWDEEEKVLSTDSVILLRPQKHRNKECILQVSRLAPRCLADYVIVQCLIYFELPPIGSVVGSTLAPGASSSCGGQLYRPPGPG